MSIAAVSERKIELKGINITAIQGARDVPFPIILNDTGNVAGIQFELNYPTYLSLKNTTKSSEFQETIFVTNTSSPGISKIAMIFEENLNTEEEKILNVIFDINESALPGEYAINFSETVVSNIQAEKIPTTNTNNLLKIVLPYNFTFLPPISLYELFTLADNSTLPFKFNVTDENGTFISDNSVKVRIFNLSLGIDKTYIFSEEENNEIRIDSNELLYILNIHTQELEMPLGNYTIEVYFDNFQKETIGFELIEPGKGYGKNKN
jgi:hypothetical protein